MHKVVRSKHSPKTPRDSLTNKATVVMNAALTQALYTGKLL